MKHLKSIGKQIIFFSISINLSKDWSTHSYKDNSIYKLAIVTNMVGPIVKLKLYSVYSVDSEDRTNW